MVISKKALCVVTLCLMLAAGSRAFAACPNVKGVWNMSFTEVHYDLDALAFGDGTGADTINVVNQIGCLFYGTNSGGVAFTGVITGLDVTITGQNSQLNGTLGNPDPVTGRYRKIVFTGSGWPTQPATNWISTMKGKFTRTF